MCPCPKGHAGIQFQHDVICFRLVRLPGRFDHNMPAHAGHMEILLPFIGPVFLADMTEQRGTKPKAADAFFHRIQLCFNFLQPCRQFFVLRIVGSNRHYRQIRLRRQWVAQLKRQGLPQRFIKNGIFNSYAVPGARLPQYLRRCLFRLVIDFNAYLQPLFHNALPFILPKLNGLQFSSFAFLLQQKNMNCIINPNYPFHIKSPSLPPALPSPYAKCAAPG